MAAAPLKVLIAGGTGEIGAAVTAHLRALGHQVTVLTRTVSQAVGPAISWDDPGLAELASGTDVIVNLAGENIWSGRWTARKKFMIRQSRLDILRRLLALMAPTRGPGVFVNASGIAYYGTRASRDIPDESASAGEGFLAEICRENEALVNGAVPAEIRTVHLRIGITLSRGGVALRKLSPLQRNVCVRGIGSGKQWFSWIHIADVAELVAFALTTPGLSGPMNATAPTPVTFDEMTRLLALRFGRPRMVWISEASKGLLVGFLRSGIPKSDITWASGTFILAAVQSQALLI